MLDPTPEDKLAVSVETQTDARETKRNLDDPYYFCKSRYAHIDKRFGEIMTFAEQMKTVFTDCGETNHQQFVQVFQEATLTIWQEWQAFWENS